MKGIKKFFNLNNFGEENEITGEREKFLVDISVLITTYNHEKYIRQCLDGVLKQSTNFSYEIIVHDDASTDKTQMVLRELKELYPSKIQLILQEKNLYQKGESRMPHLIPYLKGKYIAICEGDDYWCDIYKLDKQVKFLENHSEYIACYHNVKTIDENGEELNHGNKFYPFKKEQKISKRSIQSLRLPSQTASLVYQNIWYDMPSIMLDDYLKCRGNGDHKIASLLSFFGKIYLLDDIMAVHRKIFSHGDSWSARVFGKNLYLYTYNMIIDINQFTLKYFRTSLISKKKRLGTISGATLQYIYSQSDIDKEVMTEIYKINQDSLFEAIICSYIRMLYQLTIRFYSALKECSRITNRMISGK